MWLVYLVDSRAHLTAFVIAEAVLLIFALDLARFGRGRFRLRFGSQNFNFHNLYSDTRLNAASNKPDNASE